MGVMGVPRSCDRIDGLTSAVRLGLPQARIPDLDFAIALGAAACGEVTFRAERHAPDRAGEPVEGLERPPGLRIPDDDLPPARRGQIPAVGAEGHAEDVVSVSGEAERLFAGGALPLPDLYRLVRPAGCQQLAVGGAEGHDMDPAGVSSE